MDPDLTVNQIDSILRVTAVNIDSINPEYIGKLGSGRLNSGLAVQSVWDMVNTTNNPNNGVYSDGVMVAGTPTNGGGNRMTEINLDIPTISENTTEYTVVDMSGKIVNLDGSPSGMYFIIDNGIIVKRIFKS